MGLSRRMWLKRTGAATTIATLQPIIGCGDGDEDALPNRASEHDTPPLDVYAHDGPEGPVELFQHGVASGDPLPDAVVIWTRLTIEDPGDVEVWYEVAIDPAFERRVIAGWALAEVESDHTVKVDVRGLEHSSTLYYRFMALGRTSSVGRTRTAAAGSVSRLRFGVVSCSSLAHGYFHVYRHLASRPDLEAILHLGDYIYEYGVGQYGVEREYEPSHPTVTLGDYRMRYSQYRRDPDLQEVHRQHPMIHVWDDHEIANDSWSDGAENHDPETEGSYADRKAAAMRAYAEWMPVRDPAPSPLYRRLAYGDLVDLFMLDTRNEGRSEQLVDVADDSDQRTMLGFEQEAWLEAGLIESAARWRILGQQVMLIPVRIAAGLSFGNNDAWDGYPAARARLLRFLRDHGVDNVVVLTGDIHTSWSAEVALDPYDPEVYDPETGDGAIAVEFVTPAVSSPGLPTNGFVDRVLDANPHIHFTDHVARGCIVLDVRRDRVQADWFHVDGVQAADSGEEVFVRAFTVGAGDPRCYEAAGPARPRKAPPLAP